MSATLIDGSAVARTVRAEVAAGVADLRAHGGRAPCLATVLVGDDLESAGYVRSKRRACMTAGIRNEHHDVSAEVTQTQVAALLRDLATDPGISGILLQLPLPAHLDGNELLALLPVEKDVDGLTIPSVGRLAGRRPCLRPCTPAGILRLLDEYEITLSGAHAVVVGRSSLVGRPMAQMLTNRGATVTVCHSRTKDLKPICGQADVLVVAAGVPHLIGRDAVRPGAAVIDVGIHRGEHGLHGDVQFDEVVEVAGTISPVPGGVGPMTVAMLVANTLSAAQWQQGLGLPPV
jgi:methylenetetrahydrofolate dehydrogenase (NADP+)/methenyltetrahydrofolate cyclohydrolase